MESWPPGSVIHQGKIFPSSRGCYQGSTAWDAEKGVREAKNRVSRNGKRRDWEGNGEERVWAAA